MPTPRKALVVLSGGQDSTTCLFWAVSRYGRDNVYTVTFDYGQRHSRELEAAWKVAHIAGVSPDRLKFITLGANILAGTSPLTDHAQELEQYENFAAMDKIIGDRIEKTFVPMRNALFLTIAANRAAVIGNCDIVTGVCQQDNANYPDCRESFIDSQMQTINEALGTDDADTPEEGMHRLVNIRTPLMHLTKAQSIDLAMELGPVAYGALGWSHTAYDGQYPPVGRDHATVLRAQGFKEAHVPDPLVVRAHMEGLMPLPDGLEYEGSKVDACMKVLDAIREEFFNADRFKAGAQ